MSLFNVDHVANGLPYDVVHKFGYNADIDTTTDPETVWSLGGVYTWVAAAGVTTIVSSDAADTMTSGTGAWTVTIQGVDASGNALSETVEMDGLNAVTLTGVFYRTHRAFVATSGTAETNVGFLTVKIGATSTAYVGIGDGQTLMAVYTVPNDYSWCQLRGIWVSIGKKQAATVQVRLSVRPSGGSWRVFDQFSVMTVGSSSTQVVYPVPISISPGSDIEIIIVETDTSDVSVSASFDLILGN